MAEASLTSARQLVERVLSRRQVRLPAIPKACIVTHRRGLIPSAQAKLRNECLDLRGCTVGKLHLFHAADRPPFGAVTAAKGAPMAAAQVEELAALGFEQLWLVGPVGHPSRAEAPILPVGDLVVATAALVYEGTSPHYQPGVERQHTDPAMVERLRRSLDQNGRAGHVGVVATTDGLYRETASFLQEVIDRGATAIDMELSAMLTACRATGLRLAALFVISDVVHLKRGWELSTSPGRRGRAGDRLLPILLDCLTPS